MAEKKSFLTVWLPVAGVCAAVAVGFYQVGHQSVGIMLLYVAAAILVLCVLAAVSTPAARLFLRISIPFTWIYRGIVLLVAEAYGRSSVFLLRPIISRTLKEHGFWQSAVPSWSAQTMRGHQGSDFLVIAKKDHNVRGAHFIIRPDYNFPYWRAGFRLTSSIEDVQGTPLKDSVLYHVAAGSRGGQPRTYLYLDGRHIGDWALQAYQAPRPSFELDFCVYSGATPDRFHLVVRADKEHICEVDFSRDYAEQLVLIAWGDGHDFCVHFDKISVDWVPV